MRHAGSWLSRPDKIAQASRSAAGGSSLGAAELPDPRPFVLIPTAPLAYTLDNHMGFYLRKSVRVGPLRFNLSGSGIGVSAGIRGFRVGTGPRGNYVHVGSHGLYYRASLGNATPTRQTALQPAQEPPRATIDGLPEIESGNAQGMAPASALELLEEIRTKRARVRLWPFHVLVGALGLLLLAVSEALPAWALIIGLVTLTASAAWVRAHDFLRKTVVLLYDLEGPIVEAYQSLHDGFDWLANCGAVWHLAAQGQTLDRKYQAGATHLVKRRGVRLSKGEPPGITTNVEVPLLPVGRQTLFLLPDRVLVVEGSAVGVVEYRELQAEADTSGFIETDGVPSDAQVIGHTWRYVNKSGAPDRRFKGNVQIPRVLYGDLRLRSASGLNEALQTSNKDAPAHFAAGVATLAHALAGGAAQPRSADASEPSAERVPPEPAEPGPAPETPSKSGQKLFFGVLVGVPVALLVAGIVAVTSKPPAGPAITQVAQVVSSSLPNAQASLGRPGKVTRSSNASHIALLSRGSTQRTAALSLIVKRSGRACTGTRHYFQRLEPESSDAFWNIACSNGKAYAVRIRSKAGNVAEVMDCAVLKRDGRECFKK